MKNKELFEKTVSILVKAYQNDMLMHGNCHACAVGNMVADNMGFHYDEKMKWANGYNPNWQSVFMTEGYSGVQHIYGFDYAGLAKEEIDSTGYSYEDLAKIEHSFETANHRKNDPDGYLGLMAVVDTLMLIHEATKEEAESAKLQFVKL